MSEIASHYEDCVTIDSRWSTEGKYACETNGCKFVANRLYNLKGHCRRASHHSSRLNVKGEGQRVQRKWEVLSDEVEVLEQEPD